MRACARRNNHHIVGKALGWLWSALAQYKFGELVGVASRGKMSFDILGNVDGILRIERQEKVRPIDIPTSARIGRSQISDDGRNMRPRLSLLYVLSSTLRSLYRQAPRMFLQER